jgi:dUTP pyrophosphatase
LPKIDVQEVFLMQSVLVQKLSPNALLPTYGSAEAAGADLYACLEQPVTIAPGASEWIPTGIALEVPKGCAGLIYARSGLACKKGLAPANKVGVIDSDYRGQVVVVLHNHGAEPQRVEHGERIAQLVITPVLTPSYEEVKELSSSERGAGGFGSTGS